MKPRRVVCLLAGIALSISSLAIAEPADNPNGHAQSMGRAVIIPGEDGCSEVAPVMNDREKSYSDRKELRKLWMIGLTSSCKIKAGTQSWDRAKLGSVLEESFDWFDCLHDQITGSGSQVSMLVPALEPHYPVSDSQPIISREGPKVSENDARNDPLINEFVAAYSTFKKDFVEQLVSSKSATQADFIEFSRQDLVDVVGSQAVTNLESDLRAAFGKH